ncbi:polyprenyl synthetase family protein [Nitrosomonadales bacterium]|nr:polyprenyl synthetase family protein [Nitrosomonadales bacterium]
MTEDFEYWIKYHQERVENFMMKFIKEETSNSLIHEVCRYASLNGGKRFRALLSYAIGESNQTDKIILDHIAAAIEFIHAYSLIHDDLPSMDNDNLRRGKLTSHIKFDEAQAILAGDALQSIAFQILSTPSFPIENEKKVKIIHILSNAIGVNGMVKGQSLDMENTSKIINKKELQILQNLKTGLLFNATGAISQLGIDTTANKDNTTICNFCTLLGKIYQITDDILDYESNDQTLGKTSGKDKKDNKFTYISLLGIEEAKKINLTYFKDMKKIINSIPGNTIYLEKLATKIYERNY